MVKQNSTPQNKPDEGQAVAMESLLPPNIDFEPNAELIADGWERRFATNPDQMEDTVRLYNELGYEVRSEPISPSELSAACGDCRLVTCQTYVTIYTRKQQ